MSTINFHGRIKFLSFVFCHMQWKIVIFIDLVKLIAFEFDQNLCLSIVQLWRPNAPKCSTVFPLHLQFHFAASSEFFLSLLPWIFVSSFVDSADWQMLRISIFKLSLKESTENTTEQACLSFSLSVCLSFCQLLLCPFCILFVSATPRCVECKVAHYW